MRRVKIIVYIVLTAIAVSGLGVCTAKVQTIRKALPAEQLKAQALMVNPHLLKTISGEFKGLLADYLLLKASVFLGGAWEMSTDDWDAVTLLFKQSMILDPRFFQTGYYIQGNIAWRKGMHAKAVELLREHAQHRDWDWEPLFYVGFDSFYYLHDTKQAAAYLKTAAEIPGAPPIVGTLGARLLHRSSQTVTAIAMLEAMFERTDNLLARKSLTQRLDAYRGVYVIEKAISRFQAQYGRTPARLDELMEKGILDNMPANPLGDTFYYDPDTARVYFDLLHQK